MSRTWMALSAVGGLALAALLGVASQPEEPALAPKSTPPKGRPRDTQPAGSDINRRWLPPGTYSALVISTSATERTWWVSLDTARGTFPLTIGPQQTVTITFNRPWEVKATDDARITSRYVPFGDYSQFNPLNNQRVQLFAWGTTNQGPVTLAPPRDGNPP